MDKRQAKEDNPKQQKGCIAKQIQLQQKGPLHGPRHSAAALEQNANVLSSVVNLRIPLVVESALPTTPNAIMTADMIGEDIWSVILAHAPDGLLVFALTCRVLRDVVRWQGQIRSTHGAVLSARSP